MKKYLVEIENRLSDEWKFAIKNASILIVFFFLLFSITLRIDELITSIFPNDLILLAMFLSFVLYIGGYFVFFAVLFRIILNFLNYYKEK